MTQTSNTSNDSIQVQVEALTAVAKKLSVEGKDLQALEAYKSAAELMRGAPWLQHRTAELARKLNQPEVAALHYRRAAAAFIGAGFPKRALSPLRTAWQVSVGLLPASASTLITISLELASVQRELGFAADARLTTVHANQALKLSGSSERVPAGAEFGPRSSRPPGLSDSSQAPDSGVKTSAPPLDGLLSRLQAAVKP